MVEKITLKEIALEQADALRKIDPGIPREKLNEIQSTLKLPHVLVVAGIRRVGKSTLMHQIMTTYYKDRCYYFNFEDERLMHFGSEDFNGLYEVFMELFDEQKTFFLDEIQNVPGWEHFVRRMQDSQCKFFISGSNATLLSRELGTKLTGRHITTTLYPFSFREFLLMHDVVVQKNTLLKTSGRAKVKRLFNSYLQEGGMPEYLKYKDQAIVKSVYEDILYKDIMVRHDIKETRALRELALYYVSNAGSPVSFNKLKASLKLGSTNTVKAYTDYLEDSFLFFAVRRFSYSLKQQYIAAKKIYCIDNGLASAVAFSFSANKGGFLENLVFIELKRRGKEIYYYKTKNDLETDFVTVEKGKPEEAIQVCWNMADRAVSAREIKAMTTTLKELSLKNGLILTNEERDRIKIGNFIIDVMPVWQWLLEV